MVCRICDQIGLRSFRYVPFAYYVKGDPYAKGLSKEEFELLLRCDGNQELKEEPLLAELLERGLAEPCKKGTPVSQWSGLHTYRNRYFPKMNLMITGKCNYNCLHCFNAADNAPILDEWNYEELCHLLDEARDCGIHAFTITGGEPMLYPHFVDVLRQITARGMFVEELNTNGYFITQDILDEMKGIGCMPLVKISFDGLGVHDWIRQRAGAEKKTFDAIHLCVENGFSVMAQTQVNQKTYPVLLATLEELDRCGVQNTRLIRTTETHRWVENAGDATISLPDYYEKMLSLVAGYTSKPHTMDLDVWLFMRLFSKEKAYKMSPIMCLEGEYKESAPVCKGNRGMVGVTSKGDVVPCLQMSGYMEEHHIRLGNLHEQSLESLLTSGDYYDVVCCTRKKLKEENGECAACPYFEICCGGCRALGVLYSRKEWNVFGTDHAKCLFFKEGWYGKITETLSEWENLTEIQNLKI